MRRRLLAVSVRVPRTHGALRAVARVRAGRHAVAAVAVVVDGTDVLVAEHAFRDGLWALPGGWVNRREDPFRAVEREVREEVGLAVEAQAVVHCERQGDDDGAGPSAITVAFRCRLVAPRPPTMQLSGELRSARWIAVDGVDDVLTAFERDALAATMDGLRDRSPERPGPS
jgi:ADP-ribose pyrophosphatase YjhB (NUDIX family)